MGNGMFALVALLVISHCIVQILTYLAQRRQTLDVRDMMDSMTRAEGSIQTVTAALLTTLQTQSMHAYEQVKESSQLRADEVNEKRDLKHALKELTFRFDAMEVRMGVREP